MLNSKRASTEGKQTDTQELDRHRAFRDFPLSTELDIDFRLNYIRELPPNQFQLFQKLPPTHGHSLMPLYAFLHSRMKLLRSENTLMKIGWVECNGRNRWTWSTLGAVFLWIGVSGTGIQSGYAAELEKRFSDDIVPILNRYCIDCHGREEPEAKLDVSQFDGSEDVSRLWHSWQAMLSRVHEHEMPPSDFSPQPTDEERRLLEDWTAQFRKQEANRNAGDPGPISTRRLNNSELNYTLRDLTGVDIRPAASFPVDPANEAGFDNSAESLTMSPSLVSKYLDAARLVADHLVLTRDGIAFAPHPVITDTDRDKYCVQRIIDFYRSRPMQVSSYLYAGWKLDTELQSQSGNGNPTLQDSPAVSSALEKIASEEQLSPKYLRIVWSYLTSQEWEFGPGLDLQKRWQSIPRDLKKGDEAKQVAAEMAEYIATARKPLRVRIENLRAPRGINSGSQPLVLWKNQRMAESRRSLNNAALDPSADDCVLSDSEKGVQLGTDEAKKEALVRSYAEFCSVFPDTFVVQERGRTHLTEEEAAKEAKGRLLSAGFHSMMGYFRDDQPLCELILDQHEIETLNRLWDDLLFVSHVPTRQYSGFLWFERAEASFLNDEAFHFVRAEDKSATSSEMIQRFKTTYVEKLWKMNTDAGVINAVEAHFDNMDRQLRSFEHDLEEAKPKQIEALLRFAQQAIRRPLSPKDTDSILRFYQASLKLPTADHRTAMEDTLISILISPSFLYRWDLESTARSLSVADGPENQVDDLSDLELASRLSYFLWCSKPDSELMELAHSKRLQDPDVLREQLFRMLQDPRARGMVTEFMGNWLDFRRFDSHNAVDRAQFPEFDDALRSSMGMEPIVLFESLLRDGGRLSDLISANFVLVDERLAKHYGIPTDAWKENRPKSNSRRREERIRTDGESWSDVWKRIEDADAYQRGGLLSMGVFLTQNSPGLRTSPVKRGYWVVRKLIGEQIPPPPPNVPELPNSEADLGEKTLREALAIHRSHASCAACHNRFDSAGLLLEGFDPIGRPRTRDLGGRSISTDATLPDGTESNGIDGLKAYIEQKRMGDFRRHFCESLAAFSLGRTLIISDDLLVESMMKALENSGDRISSAFECIILSPQFRKKRIQPIRLEQGVAP